MSTKRQATTDLNHDNWDQDDPADHEEMGTYKPAARDVLEKRVIRTAKRRSQLSTGSETKKSVFSGFGGFQKAQPSSFDFLANLTNGSKSNGSPATATENTATSSIFGSKPQGENNTSSGGGFFSIPVTSTPAAAPTFGSSMQSRPVFGVTSTPTTTAQSLLTNAKAELTGLASSINKPTLSSANSSPVGFTFKTTASNVASTMFGTPTTAATNFLSSSSATSSISPLKNQPVSCSTPLNSGGMKSNNIKAESKIESDSKKLTYYAKLKGLNDSVSDWIKKHVEETPLCILTPIFRDYEKHLKEIQEEFEGTQDKDANENNEKPVIITLDKKISANEKSVSPATSSSLFASAPTNSKSNSLFSPKTSTEDKPSLFGTNPSKVTGGFSFGVSPTSGSPSETKSPAAATPFSFDPSPNTSGGNAPAPFSFGIGQKFSFSPNTQKAVESSEQKPENEDDDEPPKVEFTPVVEENSVYEKKCKVFVKKDGNFADKGVGTLYIKKIEESGKHQLIVRANTNLGTLLLNLILSSAIPTQRMGKNNVMLVCIPTTDAKPPPTPVLIRVKTAEEADELLETLNKYKA